MTPLAASLKATHDTAPRRDAWDAVAGVVTDREARLVSYIQSLESWLVGDGYDITGEREIYGIAIEDEVTA